RSWTPGCADRATTCTAAIQRCATREPACALPASTHGAGGPIATATCLQLWLARDEQRVEARGRHRRLDPDDGDGCVVEVVGVDDLDVGIVAVARTTVGDAVGRHVELEPKRTVARNRRRHVL